MKDQPQPAPRIPLATYRLQFNAGFTFRQAEALVPYLHRLGVGDLYASPIFHARPGSAHGYDIVDCGALNPELGGAEGFHALAEALRARGMGLLLDIVPNHLCVGHQGNRWWNDVLRHGQASRYARVFDIDWAPTQPELHGRLVLPILLAPLLRTLAAREITLAYTEGEVWVRYGERRLPTDPATWTLLLEALPPEARAVRGAPEALEALAHRLTALPSRDDPHPETVHARHAETAEAREALAALLADHAALRRLFGQSLTRVAADVAPDGTLARFLERQVYRLMYWPEGLDVLNYRRYADVSDLAGVCQEHPDVFLSTHELVLDLIGTGAVTGLRVDHPDGLLDPPGYFLRLQRGCALMLGALREPGRGLTGSLGRTARPFYLLAEKILSGEEPLRPDWPVFGTTGYEVLHLLNGLFLDPAGELPLREGYARFTGRGEDFAAVLLASKRHVLAELFQGEHARLTQRLAGILADEDRAPVLERAALHEALGEVIAAFPVYTHYLRRMGPPPESEAAFVLFAVEHAQAANPHLPVAAFEWIRTLLVLEGVDTLTRAEYARRQAFALRFRQMLSAVMGKGLEDTALYRYVPLTSLNEMGGDPAGFTTPLPRFHAQMADRQRLWPHGLSTTSTHDTKRSEDVRARLNVLSEIPDEWNAALARWWALHRPLRRDVAGRLAPDANEACLFYQSLLGAWPMDAQAPGAEFTGRIQRYLRKALREAKLTSTWIKPNEAYEQAVLDFAADALAPGPDNAFLADFARLHGLVALPGACNSLAQLVLKLTLPGVPDLYQGCELWDLSLVDPDNRRPVDFALRDAALAQMEAEGGGLPWRTVQRLREGWRDGRIKLHVTRQALHFRRERRHVFETGTYRALEAAGARADHVVAFAREAEGAAALTVVGRRLVALGAPERMPLGRAAWGDTHVLLGAAPPARYRCVFSGEIVEPRRLPEGWALDLAEAFAHLPVTLLERIR